MDAHNLFEYKGVDTQALCHKGDPETSRKAAEKMVDSGKLSRQERLVLITIEDVCEALGRRDFTPKEIVRWNDRFSYHQIQRRLSGLCRKGKIYRIGQKRDGCSVWALKNK